MKHTVPNRVRANRGGLALDEHADTSGVDADNSLRELLADLMHWCDREDRDFYSDLRIARTVYEAEARAEA